MLEVIELNHAFFAFLSKDSVFAGYELYVPLQPSSSVGDCRKNATVHCTRRQVGQEREAPSWQLEEGVPAMCLPLGTFISVPMRPTS